MKKILILAGRYLPGYKDGGPVRSIKNLTDYLGDEYHFYILTCDRDHGDTKPYSNIEVNKWNDVGKAKVFYVKPNGFTMKTILNLSKDVDVVYSCGVFSRRSINAFILKRFNILKKPLVVASMGMFSPMEFRLKYKKKKVFTTLFNLTGMFKKVYWSATSEMEINEILQEVKCDRSRFFIAEDLPRLVDNTPIIKKKERGEIKVVWISRITPKKNLLGAIEILSKVRNNVQFTIYGPIQDADYWKNCKTELDKLPANIRWRYEGMTDAEMVVEVLKQHHIFLFPTLGENYGHVIQEALSAGCPCILSDQTTWKNLEENGVGYVFKLEEKEKFIRAISYYADMEQIEMQKVTDRALKYAIESSNGKAKNTGYRVIFNRLGN